MAGPYLLPVRWRRMIVPVVALAVACAVIFAVTAYHDWQIAHLVLRAQNVIPPRANQEPRVQVMANIFVQNPVNDIDGQVKAQEHARQVLYESGSNISGIAAWSRRIVSEPSFFCGSVVFSKTTSSPCSSTVTHCSKYAGHWRCQPWIVIRSV
jgi:hypothetical protein